MYELNGECGSTSVGKANTHTAKQTSEQKQHTHTKQTSEADKRTHTNSQNASSKGKEDGDKGSHRHLASCPSRMEVIRTNTTVAW